jgi:undecaprenyl-diphosphatase
VSETVIAIILGVVEGLTEYLPISSTGHLVLTGEALSFTGDRAKTFEVVIQLGAILSVMVLYRERFLSLFSGLRAGMISKRSWFQDGIFGVSGIVKLGLVSAPALLIGALCGRAIKEHLFSPLPVAAALACGAVVILLVERSRHTDEGQHLEELTWKQAVAIGLFQCFALWPGMSRSGAAIIGGMVMGLSRRSAAEFSFLAAVPVLAAAALHDLFEASATFTYDDLKLVGIGFVVSFITALIAVKWFIGLVSHVSLRPFAYYRLGLAALVLYLTQA